MSNHKGNKNHIFDFETKIKMVDDHFQKNLSFFEICKKYKISYSTTHKNCLDCQAFGLERLKKN